MRIVQSLKSLKPLKSSNISKSEIKEASGKEKLKFDGFSPEFWILTSISLLYALCSLTSHLRSLAIA
jgi:hypothetical protein